jgi:type VI secretion system secreted protein VgrG
LGEWSVAQDHFATITTPLGDALRLSHMTGHDGLGDLFSYDLALISEDPDLDETKLLGQSATVNLLLASGKTRYFNGLVASFGYAGTHGRYFAYHATLRPWLWLLSQASDCRIFQRMSVPDVVTQVFRDHGCSDFKLTLSGDYPERDYIVQYRETSLGFVQRLLEREGMYYYFKHDASSHSLEIVDSMTAHSTQADYEKVPFFPPGKFHQEEYLEHWSARRQVRTGAYAFTDFDFKKPKADLSLNLSKPGKYAHADKEIYEYPGGYETTKDGERYLRARTEALQAEELGFSGHGNVRGLSAGVLFELTKFPRDKLNCKYLVTSASYTIDAHDYESSERHGADPFQCTLHAVDSTIPYVARCTTPKPIVAGPQTATVVGAKGEEIWTDEYGRVKVQFHWDRVGKRDESSSCWVRVAQLWAGSGWGGIHIPRIGQEVIIEFLEGDPDRPIITGRVYNNANMPPYELPNHQTQSGIKSRSTPKGGIDNFNELRFEDKKGEEQLYMQAEKNMDTLVKNDQSLTVGNNRTKSVAVDESTDIGRNRTETVSGDESIQISGTRTELVAKAETITLEDERSTTIGLSDTLKIGKAYLVNVGADATLTIVGSHAVKVDKDQSIHVTGARTHEVKSDTIHVKTKLVIDAGTEIVFKAGAASITLKQSGDIAIRGKSVSVTASDKVNIRATSDVQIRGARNAQN